VVAQTGTGGKYTRIMFIDITDRVLLEQGRRGLKAHNAHA
jgi:hypothetical protein